MRQWTPAWSRTIDLDWKSALPPAKGLSQTDFPKDVAAMANSGGGLIVFGVQESQKVATGRVDVGDVGEAYERALHSAAVTAISPPVFGLSVYCLGAEGQRAVVVEVPPSTDGPHLIYRNEYFGAPIRNDSDTVWMKERQIEAMYRARFGRTASCDRGSGQPLCRGSRWSWRPTGMVDRSRASSSAPSSGPPHARACQHAVLSKARRSRPAVHQWGRTASTPLANMDLSNPRAGLRRWVVPTTAAGEQMVWKDSWAGLHFDGFCVPCDGRRWAPHEPHSLL